MTNREGGGMTDLNITALREAVERRRRCGCEKCEGCGSDRDALVNAAPALLDELGALRADLARISEEYGLPPTIGPAPGEIKRREQLLRDYQKQAEAARTTAAYWKDEHNAANIVIAQLEKDLAAARAVLDTARVRSAPMYEGEGLVMVTFDRAAWLAWQGRQR